MDQEVEVKIIIKNGIPFLEDGTTLDDYLEKLRKDRARQAEYEDHKFHLWLGDDVVVDSEGNIIRFVSTPSTTATRQIAARQGLTAWQLWLKLGKP